jgi:MFS family permease
MALGVLSLIPVLPPVLDRSPPWFVGALLLVGGMTVAPAIATGNNTVGEMAPPNRRAEAFGWLATATTTGSAISLPAAGWLIDRFGSAASVALAAFMITGGTVLAATVKRTDDAEPLLEI